MKRGAGFVYVVDFGEAGIKIGCTKCMIQRMDVYQKPWCYPIKAVYYVKHPFPVYLEQKMKHALRQYITTDNSTEFLVGCPLERVLSSLRHYKGYSPERVGIDRSFSLSVETWKSAVKFYSFSNDAQALKRCQEK